MWYKETGRIVTTCGRLSDAEIGLLFRLINHAWQLQGITESDIPDFAFRSRTPLECTRLAWEDFKTVAVEKDGKWMLPEQWEGVEIYRQKVSAGKARQEGAKVESKGLTGVSAEAPLDVRSSTAQAPLNRIDKNRIDLEENRNTQSKSHSRAKTREQGELDLKDSCWESFTAAHQLHYGSPYTGTKRGDFVQFWRLLDKCKESGWELGAGRWAKACENYFATPQDEHAFADLCVRFSTFYRSALDRYRKPVSSESPVPAPKTVKVPRPVEGCLTCELWYRQTGRREVSQLCTDCWESIEQEVTA